MTLQSLPWSIQGQSHPAEVARNVSAAMFGAPVAAFTNAVQATTHGGSHGVVGAGDFAVTQNGTPNMSVNVAAGRALIRSGNASSVAAGVFVVMNDATVNVAISAADPTNPRIDLVVVQVRDTNYGEAASDVRITVVTGTPAAVPAVPALTSYPNALVLAQIAVAAADTSIVTGDITDKRTYAAAVGGQQWCTSTTRPTGVALRDGLEIYELDTRRRYRYQSTAAAWVSANDLVVCTSGTRPTSPLFEGLMAYETDTDRVIVYNGSAWVVLTQPATSYTPTLGGITIGTGGSENSAQYSYSQGLLTISGTITLGTSGASVTSIASNTIDLPAGFTPSPAITPNYLRVGWATMRAGAVSAEGLAVLLSTTQLRVYVLGASTTYAAGASLGTTVPGTWSGAANDFIRYQATIQGTLAA